MSTLFAWRALLFAGELFAGSLLAVALAWVATSQEKASERHLVWAGAFGALLLLPVLAAIAPSAFQVFLSAPTPQMPPAFARNDIGAALPVTPAFVDPATVALGVGMLWLAGVCVFALRLAASALCLEALKRRSRMYFPAPADLPKVAATSQECALRLSECESGPITWGVFRPVILLPRNAIGWPRERLHAVLLHELAHIRRRDSLIQALSLVVCALYWPNPFVWMGARRLRREAEIAADDAVLVAGVKPSSYADELLQLAAEFRARGPAFSTMALFMAAPSALEARVQSVLSPTSVRSGVTSMDVVKIAGLGLSAAAAIAFACPSLAQEEPAASAPAAVAAPPVPAAPSADAEAPATPAAAEPPASADADTPSIDARPHPHGLVILRSGDLKAMRGEIARAGHEAREAIERARPQIESAVAEAKAGAEAVRAAQPQIDAAMAEIAKARPEIDKAMAEARPEIDRALAQVRAELAKDHFDVRIRERVDEALKRAEVRIETTRDNESRREERDTTESR